MSEKKDDKFENSAMLKKFNKFGFGSLFPSADPGSGSASNLNES